MIRNYKTNHCVIYIKLIIEKCLENKKNNNYFNEILLFCRIEFKI